MILELDLDGARDLAAETALDVVGLQHDPGLGLAQSLAHGVLSDANAGDNTETGDNDATHGHEWGFR